MKKIFIASSLSIMIINAYAGDYCECSLNTEMMNALKAYTGSSNEIEIFEGIAALESISPEEYNQLSQRQKKFFFSITPEDREKEVFKALNYNACADYLGESICNKGRRTAEQKKYLLTAEQEREIKARVVEAEAEAAKAYKKPTTGLTSDQATAIAAIGGVMLAGGVLYYGAKAIKNALANSGASTSGGGSSSYSSGGSKVYQCTISCRGQGVLYEGSGKMSYQVAASSSSEARDSLYKKGREEICKNIAVSKGFYEGTAMYPNNVECE